MKNCHFCEEKIQVIDYKDAFLLRRFMNSQGKIYAPKRHGTCTKHQRLLSSAIKRARSMALIPYVVQ
jgi:small subunit ribosomal protein S18